MGSKKVACFLERWIKSQRATLRADVDRLRGTRLFKWMDTATAERPLIWQSYDEYVFFSQVRFEKFVLSDISTCSERWLEV